MDIEIDKNGGSRCLVVRTDCQGDVSVSITQKPEWISYDSSNLKFTISSNSGYSRTGKVVVEATSTETQDCFSGRKSFEINFFQSGNTEPVSDRYFGDNFDESFS